MTGGVLSYGFKSSSFDRAVSTELFEHMKNYQLLLAKVTLAVGLQGKLFVHIFAHKESTYDFEDGWMSTHFLYRRHNAINGSVSRLPR